MERKTKARIVKWGKLFLTLVQIIAFVVLGTVLYSVAQIGVKTEKTMDFQYDPGENPFDPNDDRINYTVLVYLNNSGFYDIDFLYIYVEIYIENSTNNALLPPGDRIGMVEKNFTEISSGVLNLRYMLIVQVLAKYVPGLVTQDAWLRVEYNIKIYSMGITILANGTFYQQWDHTTLQP